MHPFLVEGIAWTLIILSVLGGSHDPAFGESGNDYAHSTSLYKGDTRGGPFRVVMVLSMFVVNVLLMSDERYIFLFCVCFFGCVSSIPWLALHIIWFYRAWYILYQTNARNNFNLAYSLAYIPGVSFCIVRSSQVSTNIPCILSSWCAHRPLLMCLIFPSAS